MMIYSNSFFSFSIYFLMPVRELVKFKMYMFHDNAAQVRKEQIMHVLRKYV